MNKPEETRNSETRKRVGEFAWCNITVSAPCQFENFSYGTRSGRWVTVKKMLLMGGAGEGGKKKGRGIGEGFRS